MVSVFMDFIINLFWIRLNPFTNGNGRVGRALWPLQMVASGIMPLYLSGYIEKEKVAYYKALEEAQKKLNYTPIIEFLCEAIISSSIELKINKDKILSLPTEWRKRGKFKKDSTADKALEFIRKSPIFTANDLKKETGCSGPAASRAVNEMVEKKIIRERTGNKRNRVFAAEEIIWLLGREHGSDADLALDKAMRLLSSKETEENS